MTIASIVSEETLVEHLISSCEIEKIIDVLSEILGLRVVHWETVPKKERKKKHQFLTKVIQGLEKGYSGSLLDASDVYPLAEAISDASKLQEVVENTTNRIPIRFSALDSDSWKRAIKKVVIQLGVESRLRSILHNGSDQATNFGDLHTKECQLRADLQYGALFIDLLILLIADFAIVWPALEEVFSDFAAPYALVFMLIFQVVWLVLKVIVIDQNLQWCKSGA